MDMSSANRSLLYISLGVVATVPIIAALWDIYRKNKRANELPEHARSVFIDAETLTLREAIDSAPESLVPDATTFHPHRLKDDRGVDDCLDTNRLSIQEKSEVLETKLLSSSPKEENSFVVVLKRLKSENFSDQEAAAKALARVGAFATGQNAIRESGALEILIDLLDSDDENVRKSAVIALCNCIVNEENERRLFYSKLHEKLVDLLKRSDVDVETKSYTIQAITNLCMLEWNSYRFVELNLLEVLVPLLRTSLKGSTAAEASSLQLLCNISFDCANEPIHFHAAGAISFVGSFLNSSSEANRERALRILYNLASNASLKPKIQCFSKDIWRMSQSEASPCSSLAGETIGRLTGH